ncbi:MAG: hypothetical protein LBP78_06665 [Acidaminococcales bacterium]|jgi:hypothetical protein|nr:hypothetical protein [Acidaminococcales bacterium]
MPSDYRYNPFSDAPQWVNITERHLIPFASPYYIRLNEVPNRGDPSTLTVKNIDQDGGETAAFTEVAATPAAGEFRPDYSTGADGDPAWNTGLIEFNAADAGKLMEIGYQGEGGLASVKGPRFPAWMTDWGDGSDGHIVCANGQTLDGLVQCKSLIIPYGVTANVGTAGLVLRILSQGAVIVAGTLSGKGKGGNGLVPGVTMLVVGDGLDEIVQLYNGQPSNGGGGGGDTKNGLGGPELGGGGGGTVTLAGHVVRLDGEINVAGGAKGGGWASNPDSPGFAGWYKIFELGAL